ncbi:MAG: hypothetical protein JJE09_13465, partial [Bacteroidia bacterium]|nr:hypothetical protein [Bacteroidia bacterium]
MYKVCIKITYALLCVLEISCQPKQREYAHTKISGAATIKYAEGFTVKYDGKIKWVDVNYPYQGARSGYHYLLVPKGDTIPAHDENTQVITIPLENIVCTSTTHVPLLDYINETERLVGFPT